MKGGKVSNFAGKKLKAEYTVAVFAATASTPSRTSESEKFRLDQIEPSIDQEVTSGAAVPSRILATSSTLVTVIEQMFAKM
jgi:hypothetical protein